MDQDGILRRKKRGDICWRSRAIYPIPRAVKLQGIFFAKKIRDTSEGARPRERKGRTAIGGRSIVSIFQGEGGQELGEKKKTRGGEPLGHESAPSGKGE